MGITWSRIRKSKDIRLQILANEDSPELQNDSSSISEIDKEEQFDKIQM